MLKYRFDRLQDDGTWSVQEFLSTDDHEAITYGLSIRTSNRCELYQAHRWLATFDGVAANDDNPATPTIERTNSSFAWTCVEVETETAYFHRRASEEEQRGVNEANGAAKMAYLSGADDLESLARAIEAERRRRNFYDVNAPQGEIIKSLATVRDRSCERSDGRKACYSGVTAD